MEINKFNQTMKYLTRPAERPAKTLYEVGPLAPPDKELYEVGPLAPPDKQLYEVGPLAPPDNLPVTTDLPEEGMEFQSVIEGFGEGLDRNERQEFETGGFTKGKIIRPITPEEDEIAKRLYGKSMSELSRVERERLRNRIIKRGMVSDVTFEQFLDDFKNMAADPDYEPKFVKPAKGKGVSPQQKRARAEAKRTIEGFESKLLKNISRRKRVKLKTALEADPERKQKLMAKKGEKRRERRVEKLKDKSFLTKGERNLNFKQSLIIRQLNDKIKANPKLILDNKNLMDKLSTTVSNDGNIIKAKPTLYEIEKRGLFEIDHQRDIRKPGAMKDFPYNRNPILGPFNRSGGFKDMAEKFIEKNPDPNNPKVKKIIEKAKELKITLQPEVPKGTFKTKGIGYKQPGSAVGKFIDYAKSYLPELVDDKIVTRPTPVYSFPANLPEMTKILADDVSKTSSVVTRGLDNLKLLRPLAKATGVGGALIGPFDFLGGRPVSEILLDIPTLGIAGQSLRAQRLKQTVGPEIFNKIQEQRAARSEGIGGIESAMFEDFGIDETPLEEAIQARADREAEVAKTRKIQDVSEMDIMGLPNALKKDKEQEIKRDESLNVDDKELL